MLEDGASGKTMFVSQLISRKKKKNPAHAEGQERESEPSTFFIRTYQSDTKAFTCKLPCILEHIMHAKPDNLS